MSQAQPITQVFVASVASTLHGHWEEISQGQRSTRHSHGGDIIVVTVEVGYGGSRIARLNGSIMQQYREELITSRGVVVGFARYWRGYLRGSGHFEYQTTSTVHPFDTWRISFSIRS